MNDPHHPSRTTSRLSKSADEQTRQHSLAQEPRAGVYRSRCQYVANCNRQPKASNRCGLSTTATLGWGFGEPTTGGLSDPPAAVSSTPHKILIPKTDLE